MWQTNQPSMSVTIHFFEGGTGLSFSLSVGNEQADAGRDSRTCLARPSSQARTGTGKYHFRCLADHQQDWQPCLVDPHSAISDDHTYTHTQYHLRCAIGSYSLELGSAATSSKHLDYGAANTLLYITSHLPGTHLALL